MNANESISAKINNYKKNEREMEVTSRLTLMNYEEEKIEQLTQNIMDESIVSNFSKKKSSLISINPFHTTRDVSFDGSRNKSAFCNDGKTPTGKKIPYAKCFSIDPDQRTTTKRPNRFLSFNSNNISDNNSKESLLSSESFNITSLELSILNFYPTQCLENFS
jgi:hypothetical protein